MKDYYYILGIPKSATPEEIKRAYRKLSKRLHPDHNDGDKFFEDRFKDINEAYGVLIDPQSRKAYDIANFGAPFRSETTARPSEKPGPENKSTSGSTTSSAPESNDFKKESSGTTKKEAPEPAEQRAQTSSGRKWYEDIISQKSRDNFYIFVGVVSVFVFIILLSLPNRAPTTGSARFNLPPPTPITTDTLLKFSNVNLDSMSRRAINSLHFDSTSRQMEDEAIRKSLDREIQAIEKKKGKASNLTYFTIGSTQAEVSNLQGTPTSISGPPGYEEWSYGLSTVVFEYGKVRGFNNYGHRLRVLLTPKTQVDNLPSENIRYYTLGSPKEAVIRLQGTPSSISGPPGYEEWSYGLSTIVFSYGKIRSFDNADGNLHIRMKDANRE